MVVVTALLAFLAGTSTFFSPCIFPLLPSFLSFLVGGDLSSHYKEKPLRHKLIHQTLGFILGFSIMFSVLSVVISLGLRFIPQRFLSFFGGAIIILFGLHITFNIFGFLNYEKKSYSSRTPTKFLGAVGVGLGFAAGWSPCIGPVLSSIVLLVAQEGELLRASFYLLLFCAGLGLPFMLTSLFWPYFAQKIRLARKYIPLIRTICGLVLIGIGMIIFFNQMLQLNATFFAWAYKLIVWDKENRTTSVIITLCLLFLPLLLLSIRFFLKKRLNWLTACVMAILLGLLLLEVLTPIHLFALIPAWLRFQGI